MSEDKLKDIANLLGDKDREYRLLSPRSSTSRKPKEGDLVVRYEKGKGLIVRRYKK